VLATTVQLHDIADVEGFVAGAIQRSSLRSHLSEGEHEELLAEGISILYALAARFEPHRPGYAQPGRFSGFAAQFLPRKLGDAWHKWHFEHVRPVGEDGKRHWVYRDPPISLDHFLRPNQPGGAEGPPVGRETQVRPLSQQARLPSRSPG
jgi:hypothetical protein